MVFLVFARDFYYGSVSLFRQEKELNARPPFLLKGLEQGVQLQDWRSSTTLMAWHIGLKVSSQASEAIPINVRLTKIPQPKLQGSVVFLIHN